MDGWMENENLDKLNFIENSTTRQPEFISKTEQPIVKTQNDISSHGYIRDNQLNLKLLNLELNQFF